MIELLLGSIKKNPRTIYIHVLDVQF